MATVPYAKIQGGLITVYPDPNKKMQYAYSKNGTSYTAYMDDLTYRIGFQYNMAYVRGRDTKNKVTQLEVVYKASYADVDFPNLGTVKPASAVFLRTPGKTAIFDTGSLRAEGETHDHPTRIRNYIKKLGITKVDCLILSHGHVDHCGNAIEILNTFKGKVGRVYFSEDPYTLFDGRPLPEYRKVLDLVRAQGVPYTFAKKGTTFEMGNFTFEVIDPDGIWTNGMPFHDHSKMNCTPLNLFGENVNMNSMTLRCTYGKNAILLTGDGFREAHMLNSVPAEKLKADVFMYPYHGSYEFQKMELAGRINPKIIVAQSQKEKSKPYAFRNKCAPGTNLYWTHEGDVKFRLDGFNPPIMDSSCIPRNQPSTPISKEVDDDETNN